MARLRLCTCTQVSQSGLQSARTHEHGWRHKVALFFFFFLHCSASYFFPYSDPLFIRPPTPPSSQSIPIFFCSWGVGGAGPADFGVPSRADMQAGLHFSLGGEWKPNCQEIPFPRPTTEQASKQASKRTFSISVCMCCAAGVLGTGSVAQESGKGRSVKKN